MISGFSISRTGVDGLKKVAKSFQIDVFAGKEYSVHLIAPKQITPVVP